MIELKTIDSPRPIKQILAFIFAWIVLNKTIDFDPFDSY